MHFTCLLVIDSENQYSDIYPGSVRYHRYNDQKKMALFESDFCAS